MAAGGGVSSNPQLASGCRSPQLLPPVLPAKPELLLLLPVQLLKLLVLSFLSAPETAGAGSFDLVPLVVGVSCELTHGKF